MLPALPPLVALWLAVGAPLAAMPLAPVRGRAADVPALVFVSRQPASLSPGQIPGFGPHGRALATGGRLLVRERSGRIRALLPEGRFFDVADPCVAWDGKRIVFAATPSATAPWRLWRVDGDGSDLVQVTFDDRHLGPGHAEFALALPARYDDLDPVWLADDRIAFASTCWPQRAQFAAIPVTNLFVATLDGARPLRITSERNGAEELSVDPRNGHILYSRWWFNRFLPADPPDQAGATPGVTLDRARAVPQDTINQWTAGTVAPDGEALKLAAGDARVRAGLRAYQPVRLADGSIVATWATESAMSPAPGFVGLQRFAPSISPAIQLTGPRSAFAGPACDPAALPDGRVVFSGDPLGDGDFGLYVVNPDGRRPARVLDFAGTLELDAAVLGARPRPPVPPENFTGQNSHDVPNTTLHQARDSVTTFRFDCLNVFTNANVDAAIPDAPPAQRDLRIRFYTPVARPAAAGGDSLLLLYEVPVEASGAVHVEDMAAETPMFEQLVDARGKVLRSARGPAHGGGYNFARLGAGTKCVGCHTGHSVIEPASNYWRAKWFNIAPSAQVWTSSAATGAPRNLVDRRTRGPVDQVGWAAAEADSGKIRLTWQVPIEVKGLVLYAVSTDTQSGTNVRIRETGIVFRHQGREVKRLTVRRLLSAAGTRVDCDPVRVDTIEITPLRVSGLVNRRRCAGLAEIETIARVLED